MPRKQTTHGSPVRIYPATRKRLDKLIERISVLGWGAIGSKRDAVPGIASVIDEALARFEIEVKSLEQR